MGLFKGWFKRKNAQAVEDKDKGEHKYNAVDVFVDVDGKKVSASKLEKFMVAEEAEQEAMNAADPAPIADDQAEAISMDEEFVASNGKKYNVGEMVKVYKNRMKRNAEAEDKEKAELEAAEKKAKSDAAAAELAKKNEKDAADAKAKEDEEKKNAGKTPEEIAAEEEAAKKKNAEAEEAAKKAKEEEDLKIKKENAKKGEEHFIRLNSLRESAEGACDHGVESVQTKLNRGKERYGSKKAE